MATELSQYLVSVYVLQELNCMEYYYLGSFINTKIHVYKLASVLIDLQYLIGQHS